MEADEMLDALIEDYQMNNNQPNNKIEQPSEQSVEDTTNTKKGIQNAIRTSPKTPRINSYDIAYLVFLSKFPAAKAENLTILNTIGENNFGHNANEFPNADTITKRLTKLIKTDAVDRYRTHDNGVIYGATTLGHGHAQAYVSNILEYKSISGMSLERVNHHQKIAQVASQLVSPAGFFTESLGIRPVDLLDIYSEKYLHQHFAALQVKGTNWAENRNQLFEKIKYELNRKLITTKRDVWEIHPEILTICNPKDTKEKAIAYPDFVFIAQSTESKTLTFWGEVELTAKPLQEYEAQMLTIAKELNIGLTYDRCIYFTDQNRIARLLRIADDNMGTRLIQDKKLVIMPITDNQGNNIRPKRRIVLK